MNLLNTSLNEIQKIIIDKQTSFPLLRTVPDDFAKFSLYIRRNKDDIFSNVEKYGAVLLRGCHLTEVLEFEFIVKEFGVTLDSDYAELPNLKKSVDYIYGSTPYPKEIPILYHNEAAHRLNWPRYQWFFCLSPAEYGGETPIVDCEAVYKKLPILLRDKLRNLGVKYIRNFIDNLDISWQKFFGVSTLNEVKYICEKHNICLTVKEDHRIQIKNFSPAIIRHPVSNNFIFFNQILLHHFECLDANTKHALLDLYGIEGLPRNVFFGDDSPLDLSTINSIYNTYSTEAVCFDWQQGDILLLDNFRVAHARRSYTGNRKICVALSELLPRELFCKYSNAKNDF